MKHKRIMLGIVFLVALNSCEKIELDEPIDCKVGTKYRIDHNLSFAIDSISDYRCPKNVICIWSGDVDVYLKIQHNYSSVERILNFHKTDNKPFHYDGYDWELLKVEPYLETGQYADQKDYTISLKIKN